MSSTFEPGARIEPYHATRTELLGEAAVMLLAAGAVAWFGANTALMTVFIACLLVVRFALLYRRGDVVVFVAGVILGGGNDLLSMWQGVYRYTPPTLLPLPIPGWMVVFWGEAYLFFRRLMRYRPFVVPDHLVRRGLDLPLALDLLMLIPLKRVVYRYAAVPWVPDTVFAVALLLRYLLVPPRPHERRLLLTILVLGPLYEILLIGAGLYVYQHGRVFGMPIWLIVFWVYVFRMLKALFDRLELRFCRGRSQGAVVVPKESGLR
jgi:hypothetical protein